MVVDSPRTSPPIPGPQRDPEFDAASGLSSFGDQRTGLVSPTAYLRVVANPFLGLAGLIGWLMTVRGLVRMLRANPDLIGPLAPILAVLLLALLFWLPGMLFQFHCLDCGVTGRLGRWRSHICPLSQMRRWQGKARRFAGPPPFVQNILWIWLVLTGLILTRLVGWL